MPKERILIVEDDCNVAATVADTLETETYVINSQSSGERALEELKQNTYDLAILDIALPGISGLEVLKQIRSAYPDTAVVMLTASDKAETAVAALRQGAANYVTKPFELEHLLTIVQDTLKEKQLQVKEAAAETAYRFTNIIGESAAMKKVYQKIYQAAHSRVTVLLLGETGTGKELVAQTIHVHSSRSQAPFKAVNCSAVPETLIESELFGHEKGAFTGATQSRPGILESADGGTLFLDEIGDFKPELQVKLLRVLERHTFTRVGSAKEIAVDLRLICATNKNLKELVANGIFRKDLYYRINTFPIKIPPLRERKKDIPWLTAHFLERLSPKQQISPQALKALAEYDWPGNVRELKNVISRIVASLRGTRPYTIFLDHIPEELKAPGTDFPAPAAPDPGSLSLKDFLQQAEKERILRAMAAADGDLTKAAHSLGIGYSNLRYRLKRLGLRLS